MPRSLQHCVGRHPGKEMTRLEILKYRYPRKMLACFEMRKYHYPRKKLIGIRIWRYPNNRLTHFGMRKYRYPRKIKRSNDYSRDPTLHQVRQSTINYKHKMEVFNYLCLPWHRPRRRQDCPCIGEEENKKYVQMVVKQDNLIRTLKEKNKRHIQILENIAAKFTDLVNRKGENFKQQETQQSHIKTV